MDTPELLQYGVGGGLSYLVLKLVLDFLTKWRDARSDCVEQEQWHQFLVKFSEHHTEDKQLLTITESLNDSIRSQTAVFAKLAATLEAQGNLINQMSQDIRAHKN